MATLTNTCHFHIDAARMFDGDAPLEFSDKVAVPT